DGGLDVATIFSADPLGVLPQGLERPRRHLLQRLARPDRLERLPDPLPQLLREPVDRVDDRSVVLRVLPYRDELPAVRYCDELGREHEPPADRVDLTQHHRLRTLALRQLPREPEVERCG